LQARDDGSENWVAREISAYWEQFKDRSRILVALGPHAPEKPLPGKLDQLSERWGWADLRGWRRFYWLFAGSARIEAAFVDLLADIFAIPTEFIPVLRQEERRRRRTVLGSAIAGVLALCSLVGIVILQTASMQNLVQRELCSAAVQARDDYYKSDARYYPGLSQEEIDSWDAKHEMDVERACASPDFLTLLRRIAQAAWTL